VKAQDVSRELGVKYLLEGSVEKAGGQVRITAQLVDATTGEDLWAEQYERPLRDIFVLQDEVVGRIVTTLKLQLTLEERGILVRKQTDNPEAYDDFLRGDEHFWALTKQGNAQAREMFEKAVELDPKYADAYVALGFAHLVDYVLQWTSDSHALDQAFQMAQKAVALDDSLPLAHALLGRLYVYRWQYDQAIAECQRAVELGPGSARAYDMLAQTLARSGAPAESIAPAEKAMRLDPRNRDLYLAELGYAYTYMGRYNEAIPRFKKLGHTNNLFVHFYLAVDYFELGRDQEARTEAAEVLRISPQFSLQKLLDRGMPVAGRDRALGERYVADLRKLGLK
jgi:adenylate cyclase